MRAPRKSATKKAVAGKIPVAKAAVKNTAAKKSRAKEPAARSASSKTMPPAHPLEDSVTLVERVALAVNRELAEIEAIVGTMPGKSRPTEAERRARILASLARTLSEVRRLRAADETQTSDDEPSAARNLEEFRKVLFKRLAGMPGRGAALSASTDDPGGTG